MKRPSDSQAFPASGCYTTLSRLPVEQLDLWSGARWVNDQNILWGQGPMDDALVMGEANDLTQLPQQIQLDVDGEAEAKLDHRERERGVGPPEQRHQAVDTARPAFDDEARIEIPVGPYELCAERVGRSVKRYFAACGFSLD